MFVEGRAARLVRRSESNVERPTGLVGYEKTGEPIGEDDYPRERMIIHIETAMFALAVAVVVYIQPAARGSPQFRPV